MAGRYKEMQGAADSFPFWQYIAVLDSRTRPAHAALNGKTLKANDPFWDTGYPPQGYNCRCRTRALDEQQVQEMGLKVIKGSQLKFKPDDGFESNPAATWQPDLSKYNPDILKELKKVI